MFSHDRRLNPRVPHPTAFDGVKPSLMEWSEEVIVFLAAMEYQELAAASKDVIERDVMIKGILSDLMQDIKKKPTIRSKRRQ